MEVDKKQVKQEVESLVLEVIQLSGIQKGEIMVLGCSSSEVIGGTIGKNSSKEIGEIIVGTLLKVLRERGIHLAVQGCEHINRALVVERKVAKEEKLEIVAVVPALHAGGSCSVAAFHRFEDPVEVEHIVAKAGIDIGDTSIGMHIKHVAVPLRPATQKVGLAHVTALTSRPKLIGGERALYK